MIIKNIKRKKSSASTLMEYLTSQGYTKNQLLKICDDSNLESDLEPGQLLRYAIGDYERSNENPIPLEIAHREKIRCPVTRFINTTSSTPGSVVEEFKLIQSFNTNSRIQNRNKHIVISFDTEDSDKLDYEKIFEIEKKVMFEVGLGEFQRAVSIHTDKENIHAHINLNRIHPNTFTCEDVSFLNKKLNLAIDGIIQEYDLTPLKRKEVEKEKKRPSQRLYRSTGAIQSYQTYLEDIEIKKSLASAKDWQEFHQILNEEGLKIGKRANGFVIQTNDPSIKLYSKLSNIGLSGKKLIAKFGDYERSNHVLNKHSEFLKYIEKQNKKDWWLYRKFIGEETAKKKEKIDEINRKYNKMIKEVQTAKKGQRSILGRQRDKSIKSSLFIASLLGYEELQVKREREIREIKKIHPVSFHEFIKDHIVANEDINLLSRFRKGKGIPAPNEKGINIARGHTMLKAKKAEFTTKVLSTGAIQYTLSDGSKLRDSFGHVWIEGKGTRQNVGLMLNLMKIKKQNIVKHDCYYSGILMDLMFEPQYSRMRFNNLEIEARRQKEIRRREGEKIAEILKISMDDLSFEGGNVKLDYAVRLKTIRLFNRDIDIFETTLGKKYVVLNQRKSDKEHIKKQQKSEEIGVNREHNNR